MLVAPYGRLIRSLRAITNNTANREPKWRHRGRELTTGYRATTYSGNGRTAATEEHHARGR
jgi:hydrogenase small subunit